jgi:hypothetical protein
LKNIAFGIEMDVREVEWGGIGWLHLTQVGDQWRAFVNPGLNLRIPFNVAKFFEQLDDWQLFNKDTFLRG